MEFSEQFFIQQINEKNDLAFRDLFTRFRSYLVMFAMRKVEQGVAEDIVQETFIAVWESDKKYNSYHGFKAYLYDLVQNKCLNYLKHKSVEDRYVAYVKGVENEEESDYNLMQEEVYRELYLAIRELPEKCRSVFNLHLEGKKNDEIAVMLGISVLTVKSHKQNAIHFLKEKMGNLFFLFVYMHNA